ncbi:hypothetical protein ABZ942_16700 [Nocardia sp. NPDC046473]|uniref:hypothetical protein n=1 Tax=Nocardia sp. NPDC046473 TaxID=3155733 RepID=UPI0033D38D01
MNTPEPIFDVARGDVAVSRRLSDALRTLAANTSDPAMKEQIRGVLAGKLGVRDFARTEAFSQTLDRVMPTALQRFAAMSDEERARLAEQGRAELERYRQQAVAPAPAPPSIDGQPTFQQEPSAGSGHVIAGTRKPDRDRVVAPDDPDEDDLYFRERRQRGWMV